VARVLARVGARDDRHLGVRADGAHRRAG
jgi:hypothetical protein